MSDPNLNNPGLKPIRESRLLPRLAVEQLRTMIQSGELPAGSQLPSEPELAKALNISRSTLRAASLISKMKGPFFVAGESARL